MVRSSIVEGRSLLEGEHMLRLVVADGGTADGFQAFLAAHITHCRQPKGITLAGDDGTNLVDQGRSSSMA